jgi:hypothetical protein
MAISAFAGDDTALSGDVTISCKPLWILAISALKASALDTFSANWFKLRMLRPTNKPIQI